MSDESDLVAECDRATAKLRQIREKASMKYALESLPELIGEQDYVDLCVAIGIYERGVVIDGRRLSDVVRHRVIKADRDAVRHEARQTDIFDKILSREQENAREKFGVGHAEGRA
jgi:hypothetical protein